MWPFSIYELKQSWFKIYLRSNDNDKGGCYNCSKKHMVRKYTAIEVCFVVISSCKKKIKNWNYFKENKSPSSNAAIWVLKYILQLRPENKLTKMREHGSQWFLSESVNLKILISFKSVVIFAEIKTKSAEMTTLLKEMTAYLKHLFCNLQYKNVCILVGFGPILNF